VALGLFESLGQSAVDVVKGAADLAVDAVEMPIGIAGDIAGGVVGAIEGVARTGWDLIAGGVASIPSDAGGAVRSVLVDAPTSVAKDVATDAKAVASDAATLGSGVVGLSGTGAL